MTNLGDLADRVCAWGRADRVIPIGVSFPRGAWSEGHRTYLPVLLVREALEPSSSPAAPALQ